MEWKRFLLAVLTAGLVSTFTDWFFAGVLFHEKYNAYPEVWRPALRKNDTPAIAGGIVLGFLTSASFIAACVAFHIRAYQDTLRLAALCWFMVPLPLLITNALFIKFHPLIVVSHSVGWLAKLFVAALAVAFLLA
jgi:hypothetical protein